jgi:hypothetical protein
MVFLLAKNFLGKLVSRAEKPQKEAGRYPCGDSSQSDQKAIESAEALRQTEPALSQANGTRTCKKKGAQPALSEFGQAGESNGPFAGV